MSRILKFTSGPADWQAMLADPDKHWKSGFSARTLAHSWEAVEGFPPEVGAVLGATADPLLQDITGVLAVPEFKVPLPGGARSSQNDIFVLARSSSGPVSIMVEGKVDESFGPSLNEWLVDASAGKEERLNFLLRTLGLNEEPPGAIRYQLLHRTASALITAEQYRAVAAILLVHTFTKKQAGWTDYEAFLQLFGVTAMPGTLQRLPGKSATPLFAAWVPGDPAFLQS
jgi:hypothetical protein